MGIQNHLYYRKGNTMKNLLISLVNFCLAMSISAAPAPQNVMVDFYRDLYRFALLQGASVNFHDYAYDYGARSSNTANCKLIMYDQTYFRGKSVEITADTNDFNDINFDNAVASVKIEGNCCWTLLTDSNYKGDLAVLNPGKYQSGNDFKEVFKKASSARNRCF